MSIIKWLLGGFVVVSVVMVGALVYHALALGGGTMSWVLAVVWFVATVLIVGVVLRAVARR